jgi:hypothetical protein
MVAGRPAIFNMRLVNEYEARVRVAANEHADLSAKPLSELSLLIGDCHALFYEPDYPAPFLRRLIAERAYRGIDTGGAPVGALPTVTFG